MARLMKLIEDALDVLAKLPPLVKLEGKSILVVGDTHGYPEVSEWAFKLADTLNVDKVVFLGDYVDRGPRGVENLELLLSKLTEDPSYVVLLRGNHESPTMNYYYGFRDELVSKLGYEAEKSVEKLYECLPLAARYSDIIMLHGGVPCKECHGGAEPSIELAEIAGRAERIKCRKEMLEPSDPIIFQVLWNDPSPMLEWFAPSIRGPGIYVYGWRAWTEFLKTNNAKLLVRAHEVVDGVRLTAKGREVDGVRGEHDLGQLEYHVVTVFSSLYHGMAAGAVYIESSGRTVFYTYI